MADKQEDVGTRKAFRVQRWEIWYVYSFYLSQSLPNLEKAALQIGSSGLVLGLVTADGRLGWSDGSKFTMTQPVERDTHQARETAITFLGDAPEYLRVSLLKLLARRSAERHVFGTTSKIPEPSLRLLLPDFTVVHPVTGLKLSLEVTAQVFQSGIVIVSFQSSVEFDVSLETFINDHVNLGNLELKQVYTDLSIGHLLLDAAMRENTSSFRMRWSVLRERLELRRQAQKATDGRSEAGADVKTILTSGESKYLPELAQLIVGAITGALGKPRADLSFLLLGAPEHPRWTGIWHGSPHIHLIRFTGQTESAKENEELWYDALTWITARTAPEAETPPSISLPRNSRVFDDYGAYISESAILWVYTVGAGEPKVLQSKRSLYFPTCHNQVKGEVIEYGHALYASILDELGSKSFDWDKVIDIKERQLLFEQEISLTGQFGEVRDLLREAFRVRRVEELRQHVSSLALLRETGASVGENRRLAWAATFIAFILGLDSIGAAVDFLRWAVKPHIPFLREISSGSLVESVTLSCMVIALLGLGLWGVHLILRRLRYISLRTMIRR